jgi:hypothetical protein
MFGIRYIFAGNIRWLGRTMEVGKTKTGVNQITKKIIIDASFSQKLILAPVKVQSISLLGAGDREIIYTNMGG